MTPTQLEHLKGLIYESEMAAMIYGRQIQRLESLPPSGDPLIVQSRANLKNEYQNKWGKAANALHEYIQTLVK
ncbi:putative DNA metabolism protein [Escherichia phage vB_EcoM_ESCO47]|nr:putative DNA metabolism protein [Escherichia phage vB_EcoM_ESCO47]